MGTNKYGHLGAIEEGHAAFAPVVLRKDDFMGTAGRGFEPWTLRAGTAWSEYTVGTSARDMIERTLELQADIVSIPLNEYMPQVALADEHRALIRRDVLGAERLLGFRASDGLLQPLDLADMADTFVEAARLNGWEANVITVFEMDMGKKFVACVDLGAADFFGGSLGGLVSVMGSWDGSWKNKVQQSVVVSQCTNTVSINLAAAKQRAKSNGLAGEGDMIAFKNTSQVADRWETAKRLVLAAAGNFALFQQRAVDLVQTPLAVSTFKRVVREVLGDEPEKGKAKTLWGQRYDAIVAEYNAEHNAYAKGTVWGGVMAVQGYEQHRAVVRGGDGARLRSTVDSLYSGVDPLADQFATLVAAL